MTTTITQAPWENLVTVMITSTTPESTAPTPFTTSDSFQPGWRRWRWWRTMPDCESVNPVNTPTA